MNPSSFNLYINGFLDGTSEIVRPQAQTSVGLFPLSDQLNRGQADFVINNPVGIIDLTRFVGAPQTWWVAFFDLTGPNLGLVDQANTRCEIVRTPNAPSQFYQPGQGSVFAPFVLTNGYVLRFDVRDAANALVPGPWRMFFTAVPLETAEDLCCLCSLVDVFTQDQGGCDAPVLDDVAPSVVEATLLGPPPYSLTLFGSGFQPGDQVSITRTPPAPPGTVVVGPITPTTIDVQWSPVAGGVYDVVVTRASDPSCASAPVQVTYIPPA